MIKYPQYYGKLLVIDRCQYTNKLFCMIFKDGKWWHGPYMEELDD